MNPPDNDCAYHPHFFLDTLIALNPQKTLWRVQATRAKKNPGRGQRFHVILAPRDKRGDTPGTAWTYSDYSQRGWGRPDPGHFDRWKVVVQSPTQGERWQAFHNSTSFVTTEARALALLDALALALVECKL